MSPEEREGLETQAERATRRGELSAALALYQRLAAAFPGDAALKEKLLALKENLQPMELTSAKSRFAPEPAPSAGGSALDHAEALAARGDFAGAIAGYRRALEARPDSELLKERLTELFQMAQAQAPRQPTPSSPARTPSSPEQALNELLKRIAARRKP